MADEVDSSVQTLFKQWRNGDATAGQNMAQKFTDWFYAITAIRLGDQTGRAPLDRCCRAFAEGVVGVHRPEQLVDWAHSLVDREVKAAGGRIDGGDYPNALTGNRSPSSLLRQARAGLPPRQVRILSLAFSRDVDMNTLMRESEAAGGWPFAVLDARYALKRWLRDNAQVSLQVVPDQPDLDRGPLPLYEAARMASAEEERAFEMWLISDLDLCRDVAEFSTFVHALRAGAFSGPDPVRQDSVPPPSFTGPRAATAPPRSAQAPEALPQRPPPTSAALVAIGGIVLALVVIVAVLFFYAS
jgi:hypothetical protein